MSNKNLSSELFLVTRQQKEALNGQKTFVVWLTGLSGSGKSTIAKKLELLLFEAGIRTLVLDGDNTRMNINSDLDFSKEGRKENIRRVAEIAKLLNDAGVAVITAFISPFADDRLMAKTIIGQDCFIEIFVDTDLETCMKHDVKGLYKKALNDELLDFTGISSPYEMPQNPQLIITPKNNKDVDVVNDIYAWLCINKYVIR